jgi:HAD superfamily hydrolase (TIGR01509 family)
VVNWLINYVVDRVTNGPMPWRPGAFELLTGLRAAGVPCALVSASYRILLDAALARLPQDTFQVSVAGDEVTNGKPHPEPYERACHALGVDARHCVVLEDSETGARAGNAAGAVVVAIPNKVAVSAAPRRVHVGSLAELDVAALARLVEDADDPA